MEFHITILSPVLLFSNYKITSDYQLSLSTLVLKAQNGQSRICLEFASNLPRICPGFWRANTYVTNTNNFVTPIIASIINISNQL